MKGIAAEMLRLVRPYIWADGSSTEVQGESEYIRFERLPPAEAIAILLMSANGARRYRHNKAPSMYEMVSFCCRNYGVSLGGYLTSAQGNTLVTFDCIWVKDWTKTQEVRAFTQGADEVTRLHQQQRFWWD